MSAEVEKAESEVIEETVGSPESAEIVEEGEIVKAGTTVAGKIKAEVDSIVTILENDNDLAEIDDLDEDMQDDSPMAADTLRGTLFRYPESDKDR